MATNSNYYLNAPSLASATSVFLNSSLSMVAPDGYYSDKVISREQVNGGLLPLQICPSCAIPCGQQINANGDRGIYLLNMELGSTVSDIGAVIIRFNPFFVPDGIKASFNNIIYNKLVAPNTGMHQSSVGGPTYIGQTASDCGLSGNTFPNLSIFSYSGGLFVNTGTTRDITVNPGEVSLGISPPGNAMMVIPKLTETPSDLQIEIIGACSSTSWSISIECPVTLTPFASSVMGASSAAVCVLPQNVYYYNASLANTPGTVGLYDLVFTDSAGSIMLPSGFYKASPSIVSGYDWFEVDSNGMVINLGSC